MFPVITESVKSNQGSMRVFYLRSRIKILFNSERNIVRTKPFIERKSIKSKSSHKFTHSKASAENGKIKENSPLLFRYRLNYPFIGLLKVKKKELKKEIRIYSPILGLFYLLAARPGTPRNVTSSESIIFIHFPS